MKTSYIKFSQSIEVANDSSIQLNFDFGNTKSVNKLVGTACNELFELIDLQKDGVTKMFKMSHPIDITIVGKGFEIDTTKINAMLRTKLKLNSTLESKVRFAKRVFKLVNYVNRERKIVTIQEIEALLSE